MAEASSLERVLVTGASGYIASHVIHQLLLAKDENGRAKYTVRGTVRDASNEKKCAPLKELAAKIGDGAESRLELVSCDLCKDDGWESAVEGCSYIQHVASPLPPSVPKDPDEVIKPAVEGVERVLNAAAKEKSVRRVIQTSSLAAIHGSGSGGKPSDYVYTEEDWSTPETTSPYATSKLLAEKRAWELWKELPEDSRFGLVVINPVAVVGPLVVNNPGTSMMLILKPMRNELPMLPRIYMSFVDVRDVAKLHVMAMTRDGVVGNRYMAIAAERQEMSFGDVGRLLQQRYEPQGYKVSCRDMPDFLVGIAKYFFTELKLVAPMIGQQSNFNLAKTKNDFDFDYMPVKQTLLDAAESCIDFGLVPEPKGGRRLPEAAESGRAESATAPEATSEAAAAAAAATAGSDTDQTAVETPQQAAGCGEDAATGEANAPADPPAEASQETQELAPPATEEPSDSTPPAEQREQPESAEDPAVASEDPAVAGEEAAEPEPAAAEAEPAEAPQAGAGEE